MKRILDQLKWRARWHRNRLRVQAEKLTMALVWRLPRRVIYFSVIRVWAHGTTGKFGNTLPDDLGWSEALKRWERR